MCDYCFSLESRFEMVERPDGDVDFIAYDGHGEAVNRYETLLGGWDGFHEIHISFNLRDSELFVAVFIHTIDEDGFGNLEVIEGTRQMTAEDLRSFAEKLLAVSNKVVQTRGDV